MGDSAPVSRARIAAARAALRGRQRTRGTFALFTVLWVPSILVMAGLLLDGGMAIHGRQRALDIAEQAARAGADEIDVEHLRDTGEIILLGDACDRALGFVGQFPGDFGAGCALTGADEVTVQVTTQVETVFLGIIGIGAFNVEVEASAHPEDGA
ncbi:Tad domain-containing protein [Actinocorallia sp. API 0066]|uniref:TadE/TadG family type IV pilus assembly protein n=1 Tax=Actinocorallia sp. API 0066 TaxID=2896846 RepID=UPI001E4169D4|nr:Tad domain-containing protein [Actinocorallia sp. API 0066]MCD0453067.1 Tad domain-containing protein [Actinocorallia sp. API 0066]